jgi:hypothetical protein
LANEKGTFGHHVMQLVADYALPRTNGFSDFSNKEWNELLYGVNNPQNRKNVDIYGYSFFNLKDSSENL